jgi:hypothetical protein
MLMTVIVVASGFFGRYIYTAVPRSADGAELELLELEERLSATEGDIDRWLASQPDLTPALARRVRHLAVLPESSFALLIGRPFVDLSHRLDWWFTKRKLGGSQRAQMSQLQALLERRRRLYRQITTMAQARRFLATWHAVHIPLGVALFTAAFIHIGAALYFATLLR